MKRILLGFMLGVLTIILAIVLYAQDARSQDIEVDALGPHVYGHVKDFDTLAGIGGVEVRSCLVGIGISDDNGAFYFTETAVCGECEVTFRKSGYFTATASFFHPDCYYAQINMGTVYMKKAEPLDSDKDGVPNTNDNCRFMPNGSQLGTCMWGARKGLSCKSIHGCGCSDQARFGCDLFQFQTPETYPFGVVCADPCMEDPDTQACFDKHWK